MRALSGAAEWCRERCRRWHQRFRQQAPIAAAGHVGQTGNGVRW